VKRLIPVNWPPAWNILVLHFPKKSGNISKLFLREIWTSLKILSLSLDSKQLCHKADMTSRRACAVNLYIHIHIHNDQFLPKYIPGRAVGSASHCEGCTRTATDVRAFGAVAPKYVTTYLTRYDSATLSSFNKNLKTFVFCKAFTKSCVSVIFCNRPWVRA